MKISSGFAPPLGVIAPFFVIGAIFNLLSMVALFWIDIEVAYTNFVVIGWVHLFLLGFVMSVILGAMGQLIPVLLEKPHSFVWLFTIVPYLFIVGIFVLVLGFWVSVELLPYGAIVIVVAISTYLVDVFATLRRVERLSLSVSIVRVSHLFLAVALLMGVLLSLWFAQGIKINMQAVFLSHATLAVAGYVFAVIVAVAIVLLPMFGLSHGFGQGGAKWAFWLLGFGIFTICVSAFFGFFAGIVAGFSAILLAIMLFGYQVFVIYSKRVRKEKDIWFRSLVISFFALAISLVCAVLACIGGGELFVRVSGFVFGVGFLSFLISGHFYKIIPFLVWFEKFSPLVGKSKVPMLHEMVPKKTAEYQLWFSFIGAMACTLGLLFGVQELWSSGVSFLVVGSSFLLGVAIRMLRFEGEKR